MKYKSAKSKICLGIIWQFYFITPNQDVVYILTLVLLLCCFFRRKTNNKIEFPVPARPFSCLNCSKFELLHIYLLVKHVETQYRMFTFDQILANNQINLCDTVSVCNKKLFCSGQTKVLFAENIILLLCQKIQSWYLMK